MTDIATLGLAVDSSQVDKGTVSLDRLTNAGARAQAAQLALATATKSASTAAVASARASYQDAVAKTAAARASESATKAEIQGAMAAQRKAKAALEAARADHVKATAAHSAAAAAAKTADAAQRAASAQEREAAAALKAAGAQQAHAAAANDNIARANRMSGSMSGLAAQFQDVGVTAAMGMNPVLIALQQGTQIAGQMEAAVQGGGSAVSVLGNAFKSLFSPLTFVSIILTALAAAGFQMVDWAGLAAGALNGLASALSVIAPYAAAAAAGLALLYAPAIIMGITSVIALLGRMAVAAVSAGIALAAANPAGAFVLGVTAAVAAANIFRDELAQIFGRDIVADAKNAVNFVIGAFVGAFNAIKAAWSALPAALGDLVYSTANTVIGGVESMINKVAGLIDGFIGKINGAMKSLPFGLGDQINIGTIGTFSLPRLKNPNAGAASAAIDTARSAFADAQGTDYVGAVTGAIARGASAASEKLRELATEMTKVDEKSKKKSGGGKTEADKYQDIVDGANRRIDALKAEHAGLELNAEAAARLAYEQDLLNQAQQRGIALTPSQRVELAALAAEMADVEAATEAAKASQEAWNEAGKGFGGWMKGLLDGTKSWKDALLELVPIVLKLLNDLNKAQGGKGLFGGGFFQNLIGGLIGIGFSKGGYTGNGPASAAAGIVHGQEYVFSAAATKAIGPSYLDALHRAAKGGAPASIPRLQAPANDRPLQIVVRSENHIVSRFDADGGFESAVERTSRPIAQSESAKASGKVAASVPAMVDTRGDQRQYRRIRASGGR